jgi:hypothetical protein
MTVPHRSARRSRLRLLVVRGNAVVALAAGVALAPTPAQARTEFHADRTTDVRVARVAVDGGENPTLTPAPRHRDGDIAKVRMFNGNVVGIRVTFDELKRTDGFRLDLLRLVTNERVVRQVVVVEGPGLGDGEVEVTRANGDEVGCGVRRSTDYESNVVVIHVPRWCLSDPRSVKVGYIAASFTASFRLLFLDDALRDHTASIQGLPKVSEPIWRR